MTDLGYFAIRGVAIWSARLPGYAVARDVALGLTDPPERGPARPAPTLLAPTERRRAPDAVALALEVGVSACEAAGVEPRNVHSVFASTYGDLPISDSMCATLATTPLLCSPTKFHNSVHNAASGYWSIGTGCQLPSTALLAGPHTFGNGLLEAIVQARCSSSPVLYVAYDVEARGPLATMTRSEGLLGIGLVLDADTGREGTRARARVEEGTSAAPSLPARWDSVVPHNPMRPGAALVGSLALATGNPVALPLGTGTSLVLEFGHLGRAP